MQKEKFTSTSCKQYRLIGLMSGTSMDGLDISYADFSKCKDGKWSFSLLYSTTISYPDALLEKLKNATQQATTEHLKLDKELGHFFAESINQFVASHNIDKKEIDGIASHGHTTFHQPKNGFTTQIGCGTTIAIETGIKVINDFRTKDVALGGQGAPLVPIGDFHLFSKEADSCLNIGGFVNVSFQKNGRMQAYDICPGNLPLNKLTAKINLPYDKGGKLAQQGEINNTILESLSQLDFYHKIAPKSLGTEWLDQYFYPIIKTTEPIDTSLRTIVEHIAIQISLVLNQEKLNSVMITGGGAKNDFLIERIKQHYSGKIILPSDQLIDFKEALIFAFLGALYLDNSINTLASVTGAKKDSIGGVLHLP